MSNLARFAQNGIELVINTVTGAAYATQSGYARMSGLSQQAINKHAVRVTTNTNWKALKST